MGPFLPLRLFYDSKIAILICIYVRLTFTVSDPKVNPATLGDNKMSKRTVFTTLTPLPPGVSREVVMETLKSHTEMIDLNPLVIERHPIKPPPNATPEEYHCIWYSLTDRVQYLPGGLASGQVTYTCCFHDLKDGLQTHCYAPMGLDIKGKWTLGGSLPGEPIAPVELGLGAPLHGLWLREDVDMRCNIMMGGFVKKTLKKAHSSLGEVADPRSSSQKQCPQRPDPQWIFCWIPSIHRILAQRLRLTERCGGLEVPRHHALEPTNASPTEHLQLPIRSTRLADKLRQQIAPCSTQHTEFGKFRRIADRLKSRFCSGRSTLKR